MRPYLGVPRAPWVRQNEQHIFWTCSHWDDTRRDLMKEALDCAEQVDSLGGVWWQDWPTCVRMVAIVPQTIGDNGTAEGKASMLAFMKALLSQYVVILMAQGRSQRGAIRGNYTRPRGEVYPFHELYGPQPLPDVQLGRAALEIGPIPCHIWK